MSSRLVAFLPLVLVGCGLQATPEPDAPYQERLDHSTSPAPVFLLPQIGTDHSEGIAVMDMNGDGRLDVTSGAYWYEAPDFSRHKYREAKIDGEFVVNCGEFAIDVDNDGDLDIVSAGWQEDGVFWYENPGQVGPMWEKRLISRSLHTEGLWREDTRSIRRAAASRAM